MKILFIRSSRVVIVLTFMSLFIEIQSSAQKPSHGKGDTSVVSGRQVVFYSMSQAEIDTASGDQGEINEAMSDFQTYVASVSKWLRSVRLQSTFIDAPVIKLRLSHSRSWVFVRSRQDVQLGMILTDGVNVPICLPGVDTDSSWIQRIKTFYKLK